MENHLYNSLLRTKNKCWGWRLLDRGNLFKHCLGCIKLISTVFSNRRVSDKWMHRGHQLKVTKGRR